jgi:hypothetical protein
LRAFGRQVSAARNEFPPLHHSGDVPDQALDIGALDRELRGPGPEQIGSDRRDLNSDWSGNSECEVYSVAVAADRIATNKPIAITKGYNR